MKQELGPDRARYLGLHGNAILSRYPIDAARIIRLPVCHDWYKAEKAAISALEKGKRVAANKVFLERIGREVRQGGNPRRLRERANVVQTLYLPRLLVLHVLGWRCNGPKGSNTTRFKRPSLVKSSRPTGGTLLLLTFSPRL
jgi:hypothetical protein